MSLRTILLVLALVPCVALVGLGAMNSAQLYGDWNHVHDRNESAKRFGGPLLGIFAEVQAERRLTAVALADPDGDRSGLTRQRQLTDKSVQTLETLSDSAPADLSVAFRDLDRGLKKLPEYRTAVDRRSADPQQTFDGYTAVIASDMELFEDFSNIGFGEQTVLARPLLDAQWGLEMISREDAIIAAGVASGHLTGGQHFQLSGAIGAQNHIYDDKVLPQLADARAKDYQSVLSGTAWKQKAGIEQKLLGTQKTDSAGRTAVAAGVGKEWQQSLTAITPALGQAAAAYSDDLVASTEDVLGGLMTNMLLNTAVSAAAVLLMLFITLRLTGILRRRIFALRSEALELQTRLPDLVDRLRQGEKVDTDAELPEIRHGDDELGQLGQALNQARGTSLETAVREVELYRGFERLLQRIARRTQLLIGMQMKRLGEMQRQHEDPAVLEGLFDLDHLAARLRRYEENLVILGNGQPQRRWRRPVLLMDVMRSAQGEVQDYRRIRIDTDGETWLSERAVGPMVHVLAELMENAVSFSRPPTPVEVTASQVGRGVAIEIEDRGMGMDPEQYAEANALMADPPRMDVMSRADDARLGLYVVARLSANLGLQVELRPSSFGGTRVVVLVPGELIADGGPLPEELPVPSFPDQLALHGAPRSDRTDDHSGPRTYPGEQETFTRPLIGPWIEPPARPAPATGPPSTGPLPRRVRQASLASELRQPPPAYPDAPGTDPAEAQRPLPRRTGARSGATVGAFQRQSRTARLRPAPDHQPDEPAPGPDRTRKEDGR
ncbi:nitrate- and nitrite sensing domain-containing protein [Streptomyces sp. GESEQ-35]|uniref:sensor histidine kinase n=1 Tax=Streptomyces sp. GESEQ-35 TaxID=2812657 RepID=UPI001B32EF09|nr:nitrate- and nitrite sensing domain-containing protein [Streptomyces sp. GESEQ-35]